MFEALSVTTGGFGGRFHSCTASLNTLDMLTPVWLSGRHLVYKKSGTMIEEYLSVTYNEDNHND